MNRWSKQLGQGPVFVSYVYEPEITEAPDFDAAHLNFINESLESLDRNLKKIGGFLIRRYGSLIAVLEQHYCEVLFARIWAHEETTNNIAYQRDRKVQKWANREVKKNLALFTKKHGSRRRRGESFS